MMDPTEITWGPHGVTHEEKPNAWRHELDRRYVEQAELRAQVYAATHPRIPAKKLARLAGMNVRTLYEFADGHRTLQPNKLRRLAQAMEGLRS